MITQSHRDIAVATALGPDVLVLQSLHGYERLGEPFEYSLELRTTRQRIDFNALLGTDMTVRVSYGTGERYFNGLVASLTERAGAGRFPTFDAVLRPAFWFLDRNRDSRIFQNMPVPSIIASVLREHGFIKVKARLSGQYQSWDYCVQYQESDYAFLRRLMEHEGIYFYFTHENGSHTLVLADGIGSHDTSVPESALRFLAQPNERELARSVTGWSIRQQVLGGEVQVGDFDFEKPRDPLRSAVAKPAPHALAAMQLFEYPSSSIYAPIGDRPARGDGIARLRMEEVASGREHASAETAIRTVCCGQLFSLTNHPRADQNREYLVIGTAINVQSDAFEAAADQADLPFSCHLEVLPAQTPFRPARTVPWPTMRGPQTAIVTGKPGEEIWTDKYGRIKVRFHWDRRARADDTTSCWVRVSQAWAGKRWGAMFLPRIGQEVIVDFLDGDPNRPIITGRVYNGDAMPPFDMTKEATVSGLRTSSSKGNHGCNELRFDDKAGHEQIFIQAERNLDTRVKSTSKEYVGKERHLIVGGDRLEQIGNDDHLTVVQDSNTRIGGTLSLTVNQDLQQRIGAKTALESGSEIHVKAGTTLVLEAGVEITIKASGSFITIGPSGVVIKGAMVLVNSGGAAGPGSGASPDKPKEPAQALSTAPGQGLTVPATKIDKTPAQAIGTHPVARQMREAYVTAAAFCEKCADAARQGTKL